MDRWCGEEHGGRTVAAAKEMRDLGLGAATTRGQIGVVGVVVVVGGGEEMGTADLKKIG